MLGLRSIAVGLVGLCAVAGAVHAQTPKDTLIIGMSQFPPNLHPAIEATVAKVYPMRLGYRPIAGFNDDKKMECFLCTEVPTLANGRAKLVSLPGGKKGMAVRFTLHPKSSWGDGTPITAKDVAFSWALGSKPESGFSRAELFQKISRVEAVDAKTFVLHMNEVSYDFADLADFGLVPAHLEDAVVKGLKSPADYRKNTTFNRAPTTAGLWNGPYMATQVQSGAFMVFERNPHWWGQKPHFKRITVKTIENTATLEANLRSGDVDMVSGELGLSIDQGLALAAEPAAQQKYEFSFPPMLLYERILMNQEHPALKDKLVRQALLHGIDRETLVKQLVGGKFPVAHTWVNPLEPGFDANVQKYNFDPSRAKALLDQAGYRPGPGGIRVHANGQRLSLEYMTTAGNKLRELIQQVLQNQWKQIGVEVVIKNVPARTFFGETLKKRQFSGLGQSAFSSTPEIPPVATLSTDGIPTASNNYGGQNYSHFSHPSMDRLINELQAELDPTKRKLLWIQMQKVFTDELPELPLFFRTDVWVVPKWMTGVLRPGQLPASTYTAETWGVR